VGGPCQEDRPARGLRLRERVRVVESLRRGYRTAAARPGLARLERSLKGPLFDCLMCGQCILRDTCLVCPMRCPKGLRSGPCGGATPEGRCEVDPSIPCVWVLIYQRAKAFGQTQRLRRPQKPLDWRLMGTSAWKNAVTGRDGLHNLWLRRLREKLHTRRRARPACCPVSAGAHPRRIACPLCRKPLLPV